MALKIDNYAGREQAFVKHSLLQDYFSALIHKIVSKFDEFVYIDGFSGPWQNADEDFGDTSFGIALAEMRKAKATWAGRGRNVRMRALLVEKNLGAYKKLQTVVEKYSEIEIEPLRGSFTSMIPDLLRKVPESAFLFIFIDPKGWRIDMETIATLLRRPNSEVLFNFMFDFINRASSMSDPAIVQGIDELITVSGWRQKLVAATANAERTQADARKAILIEAFSETMKTLGNYEFVAETPVFRPMADRALYSLIYATRKPPGIEVFRKAQLRVLRVQEELRGSMRRDRMHGNQSEFFGPGEMAKSETEKYLENERVMAETLLLALAPPQPTRVTYGQIWPRVLAKHAITKQELNTLAAAHNRAGTLYFPDWQPRKRVPNDDGRIARAP